MVTQNSNNYATGASGTVLTGNGVGSTPTFQSPATSGTVTTVSVATANGFAGTVANASTTPAITLTTSQTGLLSGNGTAVTGTAITQYNVITAGASNAPNSVAPSATSGVPLISQGASSQPVFGTAVVAGGGTGAVTLTGVLTGNGTSAVTASAVTQYAVLVGGASNAVGSVADVAAGQVLVSGGVSANPAFSATPSVTSITLGTGTALNTYAVGTFTPTIQGASTGGTTTYSAQVGNYMKIGQLVFIQINVGWTAATGTGNIVIGGLPFTAAAGSNENCVGSVGTSGLTFPTGTTHLFSFVLTNSATAFIQGSGSGVSAVYMQLANVTASLNTSIVYIAAS